MRAKEGDVVRQHGRTVGQKDRDCDVIEVLGTNGEPPYRVRFPDGKEGILSPGPDSEVLHRKSPPKPS